MTNNKTKKLTRFFSQFKDLYFENFLLLLFLTLPYSNPNALKKNLDKC